MGPAADLRAARVPEPGQEPVLRPRRGRVLPGLARRRAGRADHGAGRPPLGPVPGRQRRPVRLHRRARTTRRSSRRCSAPPRPGSRERGRERLVGPMDFTTNDECGLLIEGYDRHPYILEPWHPPYYRERIEALGYGKTMDLLMWNLEMGELKKGDAFADAIHAGRRQGRVGARDHGPQHEQARPRGRDRPLHGGLQLGLGEELGLRPDHRRRGRLPGEEPEADPRRALGVHGRARRRDPRRRPDPARHQPGHQEDERPAAALRLAAASCSASGRSTASASSPSG